MITLGQRMNVSTFQGARPGKTATTYAPLRDWRIAFDAWEWEGRRRCTTWATGRSGIGIGSGSGYRVYLGPNR